MSSIQIYTSVVIVGALVGGLGISAVDTAYAAPPENVEVSVPAFVYRTDTRGPDEIFDEGFEILGMNDNVFDHLSGSESAFVSTSSEELSALAMLENEEAENQIIGWLYKIAPDSAFFSMNASLQRVINDPQATADMQAQALHYLQAYGGEYEWAAHVGIPSEHIVEAAPVYLDDWAEGRIRWESAQPNLNHRVPDSPPTGDPYPIAELGEGLGVTYCTPGMVFRGRAAIGCASRPVKPATETELVDLHGQNVTSDIESIHFTIDADAVAGAEGRLLSPLSESAGVVGSVEGVADLEGLSARLSGALSRDLTLFDAVSSHASTVGRALAAAGKSGVKVAGELLPYVAIAATGYALSEDIRSGDWVDAGFDGVAEGLMLVGAAQPELLVFTEPLLLVDILAQLVVDYFRPPAMSHEQRVEADRDKKTWDELAGDLAKLRVQVTQEQLVAAVEQAVTERIVPALQQRLASDEQVLAKLKATYQLETHRAAMKATGGEFTGPAYEKVKQHRLAAMKGVEEVFAERVESRRQAYAAVLGEQVQEVADELGLSWAAGSSVFEAMGEQFDVTVAVPAVAGVEQRLFEWSGFRNPPVSYPSDGVAEFRADLRSVKLGEYGAELARIYPSPLRVSMPNDPAENLKVLTGEAVRDVQVPAVWGAAVPGGITEEIALTRAGTVSGEMRVRAPEGARLHQVRTSDPDLTAVVSKDGLTATVGSVEAPVVFGAGEGAVQVFATVRAPETAQSGATVTGGEVLIVAGKEQPVLRRGLDVVVRDSLPVVQVFAEPGRAGVMIEAPVVAGQRMVLTAPAETRFDLTHRPGYTLSLDRTTLTVLGPVEKVEAALHVPSSVKQDTTLTGRVVILDAQDLPVGSGRFLVSTEQVTLTQTVVPSLTAGDSGLATVRISNHTGKEARGVSFVFTAPTGTVFSSGGIRWSWTSTATTGVIQGVLSADKRTITVTQDGFVSPANGHVDLTVTVTRTSPDSSGTTYGGCGYGTSGCFRVTGGNVMPRGGQTSLAFTSVLTTSFQQSSTPTIKGSYSYDDAGLARIRITNHAGKVTARGATFVFTAPTGTKFRDAAVNGKSSGTIGMGTAWTRYGTLSDQNRTLTVRDDAFQVQDWVDLSVNLIPVRWHMTESGHISDGKLTFTAGNAIHPGTSTSLRYAATKSNANMQQCLELENRHIWYTLFYFDSIVHNRCEADIRYEWVNATHLSGGTVKAKTSDSRFNSVFSLPTGVKATGITLPY